MYQTTFCLPINSLLSLSKYLLALTERANTSLNFLPRVDTLAATVRFLRVTYVRPKYGLPPGGLYAPRSVSYATFVPRVEEGDEYEMETCLLNRMRKWLEGVGMCIIY